MSKNVEVGGLYKLKVGKSVCKVEEMLTPYVRFLGFVSNPLKEDDWYIKFIYVYKEDLEATTIIHPVKILPYDVFFEFFELELTSKEVNSIILGLEN